MSRFNVKLAILVMALTNMLVGCGKEPEGQVKAEAPDNNEVKMVQYADWTTSKASAQLNESEYTGFLTFESTSWSCANSANPRMVTLLSLTGGSFGQDGQPQLPIVTIYVVNLAERTAYITTGNHALEGKTLHVLLQISEKGPLEAINGSAKWSPPEKFQSRMDYTVGALSKKDMVLFTGTEKDSPVLACSRITEDQYGEILKYARAGKLPVFDLPAIPKAIPR